MLCMDFEGVKSCLSDDSRATGMGFCLMQSGEEVSGEAGGLRVEEPKSIETESSSGIGRWNVHVIGV